MDRIDLIAERQPGLWPLRDQIRKLGTDNLSHFGNHYTHEGGYSLQQNPDELASLTMLLRERAWWWMEAMRLNGRFWGAPVYLEIGSASGGTARWLQEQIHFPIVLSIDDGGHHRAPEQDQNFAAIENARGDGERGRVHRMRGNSHSSAAEHFLRQHLCDEDGKLCLYVAAAFIDGDHTYEGVKKDVALVRPFLSSGSVVIFHDTVACEGVERAWRESLNEFIRPLANYTGPNKPLGIGVGVVP